MGELKDLIAFYEDAWTYLWRYDENDFVISFAHTPKTRLSYIDAKEAIEGLKAYLVKKGQASQLFALEKDKGLEGAIEACYQTFGTKELLPTVEAKAAHLFYYIVKDHPFVDGNKRIGAFLFVLFLWNNTIDVMERLSPKSLALLALFIAQSNPQEKERTIDFIQTVLQE